MAACSERRRHRRIGAGGAVSPGALPALERRPDVGAVPDAALRHAADQFPASALWLLREGYFLSYGAIELRGAMIGAYQALARPSSQRS